VHGRLGPNYYARSVIPSKQLTRRGTDVDRAAADVAEAHQPEGKHEEVPPGVTVDHAIRTAIGALVRTTQAHGLRSSHPESTIPAALPTAHQHHQVLQGDEPHYMAGRFPDRLSSRRADDDFFIIRYLPIYVGEFVQAWLEFLPPNSIRRWVELKQVFVENF
jgi:hypothetical protein